MPPYTTSSPTKSVKINLASEYSLTPIQCGWIQYYADRERDKRNAGKNKYRIY